MRLPRRSARSAVRLLQPAVLSSQRLLRARLLKAEQDRQAAEISAQRRGQVGAGNRTDKIRTYNFKENRVTDHRINLTLYNLPKVIDGEALEIKITALEPLPDLARQLRA